MMTKGCSAGMPPHHISRKKSTTKSQNQTLNIGR